jgi:hypothetical protein
LEEEKGPTPKETEAVAEPQEVPEVATDEETLGATEDRSRDLHLAVGCLGQLKTWTKGDGGSRQKCTATVGRPTRRTVPAIRKGGLRQGPGKICRSGIRGPRRALGSEMRGMIRKRHRRLEGKKMHREATRQSLRLEIVRLLVESSIGLRESSDRTL